MKIIHTSDWHLGNTFHNRDRTLEFTSFFAQLKDIIRQEEPDALLVAGDVFDTATPSNAAAKMYYALLADLHRLFPLLQIVIVAGNHDSPSFLKAPTPLFEAINTTLVTSVERDEAGICLDKLIHPIVKEGKPVAWVLAVPHIRRGDLTSLEEGARTDAAAVTAFYKALRERVPHDGLPVIAMGHLTLLGASFSQENVGGLDNIDTAAFAQGITYTALGHIHKKQQIPGPGEMHYCGAPLAMSFSERDYEHVVKVVVCEGAPGADSEGVLGADSERAPGTEPQAGARVVEVRDIPIRQPMQLRTIPEQPAPLEDVLFALQALPADTHAYVELNVQPGCYAPDFRQRVAEALAGKPDVFFCRTKPNETVRLADSQAEDTVGTLDDFKSLKPLDVIRKVYARANGGKELDEAYIALLEEVALTRET